MVRSKAQGGGWCLRARQELANGMATHVGLHVEQQQQHSPLHAGRAQALRILARPLRRELHRYHLRSLAVVRLLLGTDRGEVDAGELLVAESLVAGRD